MDKTELDRLLLCAQIHFKFAYAVSGTVTGNGNRLIYSNQFSYGQHTLEEGQLKLSRKQELIGNTINEHVATYICGLQIDSVLETLHGNDRLKSTKSEIRTPSVIARVIRNAFAHNPMNPIWTIRDNERDVFTIPNVISIDTRELHGIPVKRRHYGGPLSLFKFLEYVRETFTAH